MLDCYIQTRGLLRDISVTKLFTKITSCTPRLKAMAKGDEREVCFQDGGCFSRFLKRGQIKNQTLILLWLGSG